MREAAFAYLARFAGTEAGLRRVLTRRIDRWVSGCEDREAAGDQIATARAAVGRIIASLIAAGTVDDAAFAGRRAESFLKAGKSRRAATAGLMAKGIAPALARDAVPEDVEAELTAALILARRRRIGPFGTDGGDAVRETGILARAGFPRDIVARALAMDPEEAEARVIEARR